MSYKGRTLISWDCQLNRTIFKLGWFSLLKIILSFSKLFFKTQSQLLWDCLPHSSMLQSPHHFTWAKEFVQAGSSSLLHQYGQTTALVIPKACPTTDQFCSQLSSWKPIFIEEEDSDGDDHCQDEEDDHYLQEEQLYLNLDSSPQKSPRSSSKSRKTRRKEYLVESNVKRSSRLKIRNRGFKQSPCGKANCIGYSKPPILSTSVIRNLRQELAQIDPKLLLMTT